MGHCWTFFKHQVNTVLFPQKQLLTSLGSFKVSIIISCLSELLTFSDIRDRRTERGGSAALAQVPEEGAKENIYTDKQIAPCLRVLRKYLSSLSVWKTVLLRHKLPCLKFKKSKQGERVGNMISISLGRADVKTVLVLFLTRKISHAPKFQSSNFWFSKGFFPKLNTGSMTSFFEHLTLLSKRTQGKVIDEHGN